MLRFLLSSLVVVMIAFPNALAAAETPIDFYTAMSVAPQTDLVNRIEKKFPDVKVRWRNHDTSNVRFTPESGHC